MKKTFLAVFAVLILASCGAAKIERQAERTFKGNWTLTDITYPGSSGFVDVTLFQDASTNCFKNSSWNFISNNNKGTYTLYGGNCREGDRNFVWNVETMDVDNGLYDFTLKPVAEGENARKTAQGFRMRLLSLNETSMLWEQTVSFEGKPFVIHLNFYKN